MIGNSYWTYKTCDEVTEENREYTKRLGFRATEKEKILPITY